MNIKWTHSAEQQLDQIFNYIARDSKVYAYQTIDKIIREAESLTEQPRKGWKVPEFQKEDIREVFSHPYRIIYQMSGKDVKILSVIHSARELPDST
jgi:plasmid stabilization system protein ParE